MQEMERKGRHYTPEEIHPLVVFGPKLSGGKARRAGAARELDGDFINFTSQRLQLFATKGCTCVVCGVEGTHYVKERHRNAKEPPPYHLNLYGTDAEGNEVLMTKDHIVPKAAHGPDCMNNYQVMCTACNHLKGKRPVGPAALRNELS